MTVAALILSAFTKKIWQLILTQAIMFGLGGAFVFVPQTTTAAFWFDKKRAVALGLASGGSGAGGLLFSNVVRVMIERNGLKWAFIANALVCLALLIPDILFVRGESWMRKGSPLT